MQAQNIIVNRIPQLSSVFSFLEPETVSPGQWSQVQGVGVQEVLGQRS